MQCLEQEKAMGLDQYAFAIKGEEEIELMYWRKHSALHRWVEALPREPNTCPVLSVSDLDELAKVHRGFDSFDWLRHFTDTKAFLFLARQRIEEGYTIEYRAF
jgi:hypothetical protein